MLLRQPQKSVLADSIWALLTLNVSVMPGRSQYMLDGGALLHRIPWTSGSTYKSKLIKKIIACISATVPRGQRHHAPVVRRILCDVRE